MLRRGLPLAAPPAVALLSLALATWLAGESWAPQAACAALLGRLATLASFRLDRLEWGEWGFEEALCWTLAAGVGGGIAAAVSGAGGAFIANLVAAETLLYWGAGLWLEGAIRLRRRSAAGPAPLERPRRLLIYGSGPDARELAARLKRQSARWEPYGYLDDDLRRLQAMLDGLPVMGDLESLPRLAKLHGVSDLFLAGGVRDARIEEFAAYANVRVRAEFPRSDLD